MQVIPGRGCPEGKSGAVARPDWGVGNERSRHGMLRRGRLDKGG